MWQPWSFDTQNDEVVLAKQIVNIIFWVLQANHFRLIWKIMLLMWLFYSNLHQSRFHSLQAPPVNSSQYIRTPNTISLSYQFIKPHLCLPFKCLFEKHNVWIMKHPEHFNLSHYSLFSNFIFIRLLELFYRHWKNMMLKLPQLWF